MEKKPQGRRCSVCSHKEANKINDAIAGRNSFRRISSQFGMSDRSVGRHAQDCLKIDLQAFQELQKREQRIDFGVTVQNLLTRADKMTRATEKWLQDPENENEFDLNPRDDEMTVVYLDHNDLFMGSPVRKKAKLSHLLRELSEKKGYEGVLVQSSAMDNRKLFLDSFKPLKDILEIYAKHWGEYAKDNAQKQPEINFNIIKQNIIKDVKLLNLDTAQAMAIYNQAVAAFVQYQTTNGKQVSEDDLAVDVKELEG